MTDTIRSSPSDSAFVLTTAADDDQHCAHRDCDGTIDDYLTLSLTTTNGTATEYAAVGFCTVNCARKFVAAAPYELVDTGNTISTETPAIVTLYHDGIRLRRTVGTDVAAAVSAAGTIIDDIASDFGLAVHDLVIKVEKL